MCCGVSSGWLQLLVKAVPPGSGCLEEKPQGNLPGGNASHMYSLASHMYSLSEPLCLWVCPHHSTWIQSHDRGCLETPHRGPRAGGDCPLAACLGRSQTTR